MIRAEKVYVLNSRALRRRDDRKTRLSVRFTDELTFFLWDKVYPKKLLMVFMPLKRFRIP